MLYSTGQEVGVDESGRGCVAGPVVAGAVCMPPIEDVTDDDRKLYLSINDSKKLSVKRREDLESFIKRTALAWGVGVIDAAEIDEINILQATYKAMHAALDQVGEVMTIPKIYVDGNRFKPYGSIPFECIVKGDSKMVNIAAASILAKVHHDRLIRSLVEGNPLYGRYALLSNMGYPSPTHINAIREHGTTDCHRKTFKIKSLSLYHAHR